MHHRVWPGVWPKFWPKFWPGVWPRLVVAGPAALLLLAFALLYRLDAPAYLRALRAIHEHPVLPPFLDTRFVTAQVECWRRGIDVYARNPCDPLGRTQDYSPLWLRLGVLALPAAATPGLGIGLAALFVLSIALMPWRGADRFELPLGCLAVCSWTGIFAVERGNTDLLMFAVAVLAARLLACRSAAWWGVGQALVLGAGLLKFYPLVLLALLVRAPRRRMLVAGSACLLVLAGFALLFRSELGRIGANMATGYFGPMFGARSLPFGLLLRPGLAERAFGWRRPVSALLLVLASAVALGCAWLRGRDPALGAALERMRPERRSLLLVGALLCVGCFFAHQNIGYRAVLLILTLPGLCALGRAMPGAIAWRGTALWCVLVLWGGTLSRKPVVWLLLGLGWWWIVMVLSSILVAALHGDLVRLIGDARRLPATLAAGRGRQRVGQGRAGQGRIGQGRIGRGRVGRARIGQGAPGL